MTKGIGKKMQYLAAGTHGSDTVIIAFFALGGLAAVWCGGSWAFNVRGIAVRRAENIRSKQQLGAGTALMWAQPWYHRMLGTFLTIAGLVLLTAAYALWHLS